jgi:hypothetical protein
MIAPYGFRVLGGATESRRLIDWAAAFAAYTSLDDRAEVHREAFLSAFTFGEDFRQHLDETGSTKGFDGVCWSPYIWFDIDREGDLDGARQDAARLVLSLIERYQIDESEILIFFSGSKGFHVGLPTALWAPQPSWVFNRVARRLAEGLAASATVIIDTGVFDKVRLFRAPNSRHSNTGMHKRLLSLDELIGLSVDAVVQRAKAPEAFDMPAPPPRNEKAAADWQAAIDQVEQEIVATAQRRAANTGTPSLNRATLEFIREGATAGDRHRLLFSAAANLAEFGCPPVLAHALLTPAGLDAGLAPKEVHRQIECGVAHQTRPATPRTLFADTSGEGYYNARL